jgi:hypothetical protein
MAIGEKMPMAIDLSLIWNFGSPLYHIFSPKNGIAVGILL